MKKWLAIVLCIVFLASSLLLVSCQKQETKTEPETGGYGEKAEEAGRYGGGETGGYGGEETGGYGGGEEAGGYGK